MKKFKVFLSHSSKQKWLVEVVAKKLGKFNVVYDAMTFESGKRTLEEIFEGIEASGIFVYFISREALESPWVEQELNMAYEYLKNGKLRKFVPLLIDSTVKHTDKDIPEWMKNEYNLKYISKPTKCYDIIKQALRLVTWEIYPKKKEADQLFIGRTEQTKQYEARIYDFDKPSPIAIIVSGLVSIGRRKFIKHSLINSNKIKAYYIPQSITLNKNNSIEDLITRVYGLGYTQYPLDYISGLSTKIVEEKINIASTLIKELYENNDLLFIEDNYCIVSMDGYVAEWFTYLIDSLVEVESLIICLISQSRVRSKYLIRNNFVFAIEIPELDANDRKGLFKSLLDIETIKIKVEEFKVISNLFFGYPEQISYTISLLQHEGLNFVLENLHEIVEFNTEKVARIIRSYDNDNLAIQILKLFANAEFLSFNILEAILQEDFEEAKKIITTLSNQYIIEYVGGLREYPRLNDSVKDYVQRIGYKLNDKYKFNLANHITAFFTNDDIVDADISDYIVTYKEALKFGYPVPEHLLIPSHYVNAMRELYNYEQKYDIVISLAERILQNEDFLDNRILREIRYWYCSALARKRDKKILSEVQKMIDPDRSFLLGFYYRLCGRHEDAIAKLMFTLKIAPNYYRATRELIQVYLNIEQYNEAFNLAKQSYYKDKKNPYNIQSYFRCLIKLDGAKSRDELNILLEGLKDSPHEKASEMYQTSLAQLYAFIDNNEGKALQVVEDAITIFPRSIYPYITKLEILRKVNDIVTIGEVIKIIQDSFEAESNIFSKLTYLYCQCMYLCETDQVDFASRIVEKKVRPNFSETIYRSFQSLITSK